MAAATAVAYHQQQTPAMQEMCLLGLTDKASDFQSEDCGFERNSYRHRSAERRVADLETESAIHKGAVFMSSKPFAAIKKGTITAEQINTDMLIDTRYGSIAANVWSKAWDLIVQQKAQDKFQKAFCLSRKEALDQGWSTTSSTTRSRWVAPRPSWELSTPPRPVRFSLLVASIHGS